MPKPEMRLFVRGLGRSKEVCYRHYTPPNILCQAVGQGGDAETKLPATGYGETKSACEGEPYPQAPFAARTRSDGGLSFLVVVAALAPVRIYRFVVKIAGGASAIPNAAALEQIDASCAINGCHSRPPFSDFKDSACIFASL